MQKDVMHYWEQQAKDGNPMAQYELAKLQEQQLAGEGSSQAAGEESEAEKLYVKQTGLCYRCGLFFGWLMLFRLENFSLHTREAGTRQ